MKAYNFTFTLLLLIACCGTATAQNWITSCGDGDEGTEFTISQGAATITILLGNGNDYRFYAETSQGSGEPGVSHWKAATGSGSPWAPRAA